MSKNKKKIVKHYPLINKELFWLQHVNQILRYGRWMKEN